MLRFVLRGPLMGVRVIYDDEACRKKTLTPINYALRLFKLP